jgi:uncharacterized protein (DUF433 family)
MEQKAIHRDAEIMGGIPVFVGTRVPLSFMFDYLRAGESLDTFLEDFPSVSKSVAVAALKVAEQLAAEYAPVS